MLFDRVADLPLTIEDVSLTRTERETPREFTRVTTTVSLHGEGATGHGEDVTYEAARHDEFHRAGPPTLAGEYTVAEFAETVGERDLFPRAPDRDVYRNYRRWGFESAALDLALRQADTDLGTALDRAYDPVSFVASTRLGEPPSTDRLERLLDRAPETAFKLDPTAEWTAEFAASVADLAPVRILDLKGQYEGTPVDTPPDADRYRMLLDAFPDAVLEDPGLTETTEPVFEGHEERVSWDAPVTGIESIESLPFEPSWLNIKPSRFGSVESLLDSIEYCERRDIRLYGGGQFELGVGREHVQALASLFYPDSPNDVAPAVYNREELPAELPTSPLAPPADPVGMAWA